MLVFLVAIFSYLTLLWSFRGQIPAITINAQNVSALVLCILLSALVVVLGGFIWFLLLRDHKVYVSPTTVISTFMVSQFGKYIPGNIGQHVSRVVLAKRAGISMPATINTMIIEITWGVANGCGLALLSILLLLTPQDIDANYIPDKFELFLIVIFLVALPWIVIHSINAYFPNLSKRIAQGNVIPAPKISTAIFVSALFIASFLIVGLILKIQAQWFFGYPDGNVFELTCLFSIAWLAGYLVPGAPAGLGVREVMMVLFLSPALGPGTAIGLGVTLRVTTTVGDAVAFVLGVLSRKPHD